MIITENFYRFYNFYVYSIIYSISFYLLYRLQSENASREKQQKRFPCQNELVFSISILDIYRNLFLMKYFLV